MNPRISELREQVSSRGGSFVPAEHLNPFILDAALWRAGRLGRSVVQQRAAFLLEQVALAPLDFPPGWTLAGEHLPMAMQGFAFARDPEPDTGSLLDALDIRAEDIDAVRRTVCNWLQRGGYFPGSPQYTAIGEPEPGLDAGKGGWGRTDPACVFWAGGWVENHSVRDYAKVLRLGFDGIRREVEACKTAADIADPRYPQQENFWGAALTICEAGIRLGRRYAESAHVLAAGANGPAEADRLAAIAETCARVPAEGARTLREAVQALWLAHILTCGEDGINANSIGRLDQLLQPYYAGDLAAGRITREEAVELMQELACKMYLEYDVQAIVLAGVTAAGADAVTDMSRIILEATRDVEFARDVSVRLSPQTPPKFVDLCAELIVRGGGIPFIFNDDCFVPALNDRGIALEDARDYAPIGCIELTIPGKANPHAVSGWISSTKCLELALFDGCDPRSGQQLGPRTGLLSDMTSCQQLWDAYREQLEFFTRRMVYFCNRGELAQHERGPLPCWSVLTDDCIERGRDITDGGSVYNYHSVCFLGTANTADSLAAVGQLVFEERAVDAPALLQALRDDFGGCEEFRQQLLTRVPKYGNDCDEVDDIARQVDEHFIGFMDGMRSPLGGRYFVHLFSFRCNLEFGRAVGATPDGRRAGEPLAYSLSAHQGRDEEGVTAMLRSLAKLPHRRAAGASAAIIDLDPKLVQGKPGVQRLSTLIQTAIRMGVGQLQWNVTTAERLRQAQQDPEKYGNICVRVAGYSQMFKLLTPELQEHVIARTKHRQ